MNTSRRIVEVSYTEGKLVALTQLREAEARDLRSRPKIRLGGYTALAESAWMGFALATEVAELVWTAPGAVWRAIRPRRPLVSARGLLTHELSIAEASFVLMASFFLSAALGAVRQVLFNGAFGTGMAANAYYAAFRLPDTLFSLIAGGALSSAMIPVLVNTRGSQGEAAGWRLTGLVLTTLLAAFAVLVLLIELFTPFFVTRLLAPGFDQETSRLTITLTRIMLVQPLILSIASVATAVLNSRNQFLLTGLSVVSHNVTLIAGIVASRLYPPLGIFGPTLGVLAGAVLQVLILSPGLRSEAGRIRLAWNPGDRGLREVIRLLAPNGLSVSVNYAGFIVDTAFATRAPETAGLGAIYNAFLLAGLPIALLGQAVGQATFPRLAASGEAGEWRALRRTLIRSLMAVLALALPAAGALLLLGRPVIRILFEHGQFDAAAGDLTYRVLSVYAVGLPAYVMTEVVTRGLIALRDTRTSLATNTAQLLARTALVALFIERLGVLAIPLAFAATASLETVALATMLFWRLRSRIAQEGDAGRTAPEPGAK
jgi:putative peptidoglycan lipid II flippase